MVKKVLQNQKGQGMVEYGLILALIAVVAMAGMQLLGTELNTFLNGIPEKLGF